MDAIDDKRGPDVPPKALNLAHHVLWSGNVPGAKTALVVMQPNGVDVWSYDRLRTMVLKTAGGLLKAGLRPGNTLLMRIGNTPDFPLIYLGAIAAGIVPVPTSAALNRNEISKLYTVLAPDAVVGAGTVPLPDQCKDPLSPDQLYDGTPITNIAETQGEDPAYIVFTSGTSGTPTGVVHAHRAIWARRAMIRGWSGLKAQDRLLHAGAFNWTYTLGTGLLDPWSVGATALVLGQGLGPDDIPALAKKHGATIIAGAPGVFRRLVRQDLRALPNLRHALSAGEKLSESLRDAWKASTGTDIHEAFGQSECSTFLSGSPDRAAPQGTVGFVQPGRAAAIVNDARIAQRGELGRIAVHRSDPGMMLGYLGNCDRPKPEWVPTGDLGVMRENGEIEYHGRADDVLTSGGFRVSPIEIEDAMTTCPNLHEAAAVDFQLNAETRVIKLYFTANADIPESVLQAHAKAHLATHKRPRMFERIDQLPRNPNGKLLRKRLRAANEQ